MIEELKIAVTKDETSLSEALLRCKLLADNIKSDELLKWIHNELNGYGTKDVIPDYRKLSCNLKGDIIRTDISGTQKGTGMMLPKGSGEMAEMLSAVSCRDSVAALEDIVSNKSSSMVRYELSADVLPYLTSLCANDFNVYSAYLETSKGQIKQILITVRSKLLDFLSAMPSDGLVQGIKADTLETVVSNIYHNEGGVMTINGDSQSNSVINVNAVELAKSEFNGLGVSPEELSELAALVGNSTDAEVVREEKKISWARKVANRLAEAAGKKGADEIVGELWGLMKIHGPALVEMAKDVL